jgi:hypothetical protein
MPLDLTVVQGHDQRFSALIREFFPDFLKLFFPENAEHFSFENLQWLDTELLPKPPDGDHHRLDLVAKLEATDRTTNIEPRLPLHVLHLQERELRLPV